MIEVHFVQNRPNEMKDRWFMFAPDELLKSYWTYYQDIEVQVLQLRRYVSFSKSNSAVFSIEFLKLFQIACSEVDVFAKQIAISENPKKTIDDYRSILSWGAGGLRRALHRR